MKMPTAVVVALLLATGALGLVEGHDLPAPAWPVGEARAGDSAYPSPERPFGFGIFEDMHLPQMEAKPTANIQNPYLAGAVIHVPWAALEPRKGQFEFGVLDALIEPWAKAGKKIILQIKSTPNGPSEKGEFKESATPAWVYEEGAQSVEVRLKGNPQRVPISWDAVFLREYEHFIGEVAKRYDGHKGIEFIVVGPGAFGSTRIIYPRAFQAFVAAGYTDKKWFDAIERMLGIYENAFKKTPLALGLAPFDKDSAKEDRQYNSLTLAKRAADRGIIIYHHNLRGTDHWLNSQDCRFLASLGQRASVALGLDNPSSGSARLRQTYGEPGTIMRYAFGGVNGLPAIHTRYIILYEKDIEAGTPGSKHYLKDYDQAIRWAWGELRKP